MKGFFYKLKKKLANINQEAKIGVSIILVALLFFGGVGLTKKWWQPESSTSSITSSFTSSSSYKEVITSEPVANELDEVIAYPYPSNAEIITYYFDLNDDLEKQTKSIVYYEGKYYSSRGIDIALNNEEFIVTSSVSGKVISKKNDPTYGLTVIVEGANNTLFSYSSLSSSSLKEGDKIKKGDLIGYAGECAFGTSLKTKHLHFEVYFKNNPINPLSVFNKEIGEIK